MIGDAGSAFPEPDMTTLGGITPWLKIAHLAEAHNRPVTTHGVHDLHVHLLAAVPNASYLEAHGFGLETYLAHPMKFADGVTIAPNRPGHGIEFDWEALAGLNPNFSTVFKARRSNLLRLNRLPSKRRRVKNNSVFSYKPSPPTVDKVTD
jgi:hypothetical protein